VRVDSFFFIVLYYMLKFQEKCLQWYPETIWRAVKKLQGNEIFRTMLTPFNESWVKRTDYISSAPESHKGY